MLEYFLLDAPTWLTSCLSPLGLKRAWKPKSKFTFFVKCYQVESHLFTYFPSGFQLTFILLASECFFTIFWLLDAVKNIFKYFIQQFFFFCWKGCSGYSVSSDARSNNLNFMISDLSFNFVVEAIITVLKICGW